MLDYLFKVKPLWNFVFVGNVDDHLKLEVKNINRNVKNAIVF